MNVARLVGLGVGALALIVLRSNRAPASTANTKTPAPPFLGNDTDALGRVITSEAASYTLAERTAIGWTVRNRAERRNVSIVRLVCSPCGPCCNGRPFSSARPAIARDRELAAAILAAPRDEDPTRGAIAFFEPELQDRLAARGEAHHRFTADEIRERWQKDGRRRLGTVGKFEFYG